MNFRFLCASIAIAGLLGSGKLTAVEAAPKAPPPPVVISGDAGSVPVEAQSRAPTTVYSHGEPSNDEQLLLEMINRARANPPAEGQRLATTTDSDVKNAYTQYSIDTAVVQSDFNGYPVRPPLAFNSNLLAAAEGHSNDMATNNFQGHTSTNGQTLGNRLTGAGYTGYTAAAENVYAYARSMWHCHCGFNVDWGNADPGHRRSIMNFEGSVYNEIGIGVVYKGSVTSGQTGPYVVAQDFGLRTNQDFLVGVVYADNNGNDFYDPGEGIGGVTVMPDAGTYYATTSTSGGYAIPISGLSGTLTVTFSGAGTAGTTSTVALSGDNVKLDYKTAGSGTGTGGGTYTSATKTDTDLDGFPDELESFLGSSTTVASSVPSNPLTLASPAKLAVKLNFSTTGADGVSLSFPLGFSAGYAILGRQIAFDIGGVVGSVTLDEKGKGVAANYSVKVSGKIKNGAVSADVTGKVTIKLSKGAVSTLFSDEGLLADATYSKVSRTVPVVVVFIGTTQHNVVSGDFPVLWSAKPAKTGNAKGSL